MRVALLSAAGSIHTVRWANGLNDAGVEVHVISQHPAIEPFHNGVQVHRFPNRGVLGYFLMARPIRKLLREIKPDLVNAHYASGYGTTARLAGYRPCLLSVWGSDIYDVPYQSSLHRVLVRANVKWADGIASTSHCMAEQTRRVVPEVVSVAVTPFGVDLSAYEAAIPRKSLGQELVIGTVKTLSEKYGVDLLIKAFAFLHARMSAEENPQASRLRLRIVGDGSEMNALRALAEEQEIADCVTFVGRVPHADVPKELAKLDVYVALSRLDSESFGVAIIEAQAAGRPVVVSNVGGLPEVVIDGETGFIVPKEDIEAAAEAIYRLAIDPEVRGSMGRAGNAYVRKQYSWPASIANMLEVYRAVVDDSRGAHA